VSLEIQAISAHLKEKFPGAILDDTGGALVVAAEQLLPVCQYLHSEAGCDYLANLTAVDYPDYFEVVYHLYSVRQMTGPLTLKTRAGKDNPAIPSVNPVWRGADFQEREVYDLFGVKFTGHPNLKRILLWEGFNGHPLRKDYHEPFYEAPNKPFDSRWPVGAYLRAEERTGSRANSAVAYAPPPPEYRVLEEPISGLTYTREPLASTEGGIKTDYIVVNFGPQHPSTHGVFRMRLVLDGEKVVDLEPVLGYLHRCHEKIGERNHYLANMPYTDRLDYITSLANNFGYAIAVEKLLGIKPPERAEYIRVIMAELTRIVSHMWSIGFLLNDLGAYFTPSLYAMRERELVLDLFEAATGSRMMCNYFRFGGVAHDLPEGWLDQARRLVRERLPRTVDETEDLLTQSEIVIGRCRGIGVLPADKAINFSTSGPVLRSAGIPYDVRQAEPYGIYDRFDFKVVTGQNADVYDRYLVRIGEMRESLKILEQALRDIPEGEIQTGKKNWQVRPPKGEAYGRVEIPKGELGFYVVSDGSPNPYRYHVRSPSFINLTSLAEMCRGYKVADAIAALGSLDIVLGEVDR